MGYRGHRKHLKRLHAPKHWMLDKLGGVFAPKPSSGPHKTRECLPMIIFLRNRLKYALTYVEAKKFVNNVLLKSMVVYELIFSFQPVLWTLLQLKKQMNIFV